MFFSLPLDIQKHINEFDNDFRVMKLVIIRNTLINLQNNNINESKNAQYKQPSLNKQISNINNIILKLCTHTYVNIWNDGDYHKSSYEYICKICHTDVSLIIATMGLSNSVLHNKKRIYKHMN
tara:strand:- start:3187 stop:3555 length:369 start_codon:yes stop_codon:yes gene_type:complete